MDNSLSLKDYPKHPLSHFSAPNYPTWSSNQTFTFPCHKELILRKFYSCSLKHFVSLVFAKLALPIFPPLPEKTY